VAAALAIATQPKRARQDAAMKSPRSGVRGVLSEMGIGVGS
jgi:hypothetical protein